MNKSIRIQSQQTKWYNKKELIDLINANFNDEHGSVACITTTEAYSDYNNKTVQQSICFARVLED